MVARPASASSTRVWQCRMSGPSFQGVRAVDLFAGWGGFTAGAEMAGAEVVFAANHWKLAVDAHALNHPSDDP